MKEYFTIVDNNLSGSYRKACWQILKLFENDSMGSKEEFKKIAMDITEQFTELSHTLAKTSRNYVVADCIGNCFVTFVIDAERARIIEILEYAIFYAQQNNLLLLVADYLYRPDGTMQYFSKISESRFPPTDKW